MTCRDCQHWDIDAALDSDGRVIPAALADCRVPIPALPASFMWQPWIAQMTADDGTDCPLFQKREGKA